MNRDELEKLAQQVWSAGSMYIGPSLDSLEQFATLVLSNIDPSKLMSHQEGLLMEREAVCKIVTGLCISDNNAEEINRAIRARSQK